MPILEKTVEGRVVRWARMAGIPNAKLQGMGNRSLPDRIFWMPGGRPCLVEFKRPGGKVTELQARTIAQLSSLGYRVAVFDDALAAIDWLRNFTGAP